MSRSVIDGAASAGLVSALLDGQEGIGGPASPRPSALIHLPQHLLQGRKPPVEAVEAGHQFGF
jgi:hypothetical protein